MKKFKAGDHLVTNIDPLGLTEHHGLCVGHDQVIHQRKDGVVEQVTLTEFAEGAKIRRRAIAYDREGAIERAKSLLGYQPYHLLNSNCEHFVNWCIDENYRSAQISDSVHLTMQVSARAGLLGLSAKRIAQGSSANIALASTTAKMIGERIGLPDSVNTVLGTPGDMVTKPIETLINGGSDTLSTSAEHIRDGKYGKAAGSLVTGAAVTAVEATVVTPIKVVGDGIVAVADISKDIWLWLRY
ncbi:lecithin retinol acyltransferase family protein [Shewanella algae]|uniref:lecithin retinol acyltransferase family protein n=1 Tax=Shewanella algae TaxID=38313 RepID=UPI001AAF8D9F|nr:lecithin retinol acyltransferase family protein [Shewanella algae]MBO2694656.1 lecithin retinol acyltransferase family protein [Shewanella algae]